MFLREEPARLSEPIVSQLEVENPVYDIETRPIFLNNEHRSIFLQEGKDVLNSSTLEGLGSYLNDLEHYLENTDQWGSRYYVAKIRSIRGWWIQPIDAPRSRKTHTKSPAVKDIIERDFRLLIEDLEKYA